MWEVSSGGPDYSFREEQELRFIREALWFDEEKKQWYTKHPCIKSPSTLPDNLYIV